MIKIAGKTMNRKGYAALTLLIVLMTGIAFSVHLVKASDVEPANEALEISMQTEANILDEDLKAIDVVVRNGDTAWDIQKELTPNKDISEVIIQLEKLNNINLENVKSGDIIKFAIMK